MGVTVDLPDEAMRKLTAEAQRRGVSIDVIIAELAAALPNDTAVSQTGGLESFLGSGDSGDPSWATRDIHELRHEHAQRRPA